VYVGRHRAEPGHEGEVEDGGHGGASGGADLRMTEKAATVGGPLGPPNRAS
jgi:hypothetical protein